MREILFRGKRTDNGEWIVGSLFAGDNGESEICCGTPRVRITYDVDPETVGQFTGLYDKNGKKIFEGDILYFELEEHCGTHKWLASVEFGNPNASHNWGFQLVPIYNAKFYRTDILLWVDGVEDVSCEIICNIYESKGIVEEKIREIRGSKE